MLIGSGLLAHAFAVAYAHREEVCIYAAGVSNSGCTNPHEFSRERVRLEEALHLAKQVDAFVYFGTCSVADPESRHTPYVLHKLEMEQLASAHPRHLILRLPQVAGKTPNPHTLLNYLYARISRSESFPLWRNASRNIIDVDDVAAVSKLLIADDHVRNVTLNIANPASYPMADIVAAMEKAVGKRAIHEAFERGTAYPIDIAAIVPVLQAAGLNFGATYLEQVIGKYYEHSCC